MTPLDPGVDVARVVARLNIEGRRRGRRFWARCPFHEDTDPSWMVRLEGDRRGSHYCFVCKTGGDLFDLVMRLAQVDFKGARAWIAEVAPRPPPSNVRYVPLSPGRRTFSLPLEVVIAPMEDWIPIARDYALGRGITPAQVAWWRLGYAVGGRLDGRIIFPVYDPATGAATSYTARSFVGAEKRYLAAGSDEFPDPAAMFGEEAWPGLAGREDVLVLEGAVNALAVELVVPGLPFATLGGSNLTAEKVLKLSTFRRVWVLTDADLAGDVAARAIRMALARHVPGGIHRIVLPPKKDPADLAREAPEQLRAILSPCLSVAQGR